MHHQHQRRPIKISHRRQSIKVKLNSTKYTAEKHKINQSIGNGSYLISLKYYFLGDAIPLTVQDRVKEAIKKIVSGAITIQRHRLRSSSTVQNATSASAAQNTPSVSNVQDKLALFVAPKMPPVTAAQGKPSVSSALVKPPTASNTQNNWSEASANSTIAAPTNAINNSGHCDLLSNEFQGGFYDIRISEAEMQLFLTQNRIYPRNGDLYLRDSVPN